MDGFRETIVRHVSRPIIGLKWNKLDDSAHQKNCESPVTRSMSRKGALAENQNHVNPKVKQGGMLRRARSVRDAFGTLRQKLRVSTRRKKRLVNIDSPLATILRTPASQRSTRKGQDFRMYSPFTIDTPGTRTTPRAIRMGVHQPKRFNFSSPGQAQRDVNALSQGIQALHCNTTKLEKAIRGTTPHRSSVPTVPPTSTPKRRSPRRAPIFV